MIKNRKLFLSIFYGVFVALASLFFFFDLEISKSLVEDSPNFLYVLLAAVGEFPIYMGPVFFGIVYGITNKSKWSKLGCHFVGLIATYIGLVRLSDGIFEYYFSAQMGAIQNILLAFVSLFLYLSLVLFFNRISFESLMKMKDISLMAFIVSISSFLIVSGMKLFWGRPRYRTLSDDYSEYVNFLTIDAFRNGIPSSEYCSFPSGHTNAATSLLLYALIPFRMTKKKVVKYLVSIFCVFYPFVVAFTRIGIGAHFASDVLFGFGVSFTCLIVTYIIFEKKGWLYVRND